MNPQETLGPDGAQSLPIDTLIALGMAAQRLKRVPRTGWLLRGVPHGEGESVAAHSHGMALVALALAETLPQPLDRGRLLAMCLLHDLAEAILGDWPRSAARSGILPCPSQPWTSRGKTGRTCALDRLEPEACARVLPPAPRALYSAPRSRWPPTPLPRRSR